MQLNHLHLHVVDVPDTALFFQTYFGLCARSSASPAIAILTDSLGFVLVLQRAHGLEEARYPDGHHLGFLLDDEASVRQLQARARADGAPVSDVVENGRGTLVYFTRPEGYSIEVSHPKRRFPPAPDPAGP